MHRSRRPPTGADVEKDHEKVLEDFLSKHYIHRIKSIAEATDKSEHYSVDVNVTKFENENPATCLALLPRPEYFLPLLKNALRKVEALFTDEPKPRLHARVHTLPSNPLSSKQTVSVLRSRELGKLICMVLYL